MQPAPTFREFSQGCLRLLAPARSEGSMRTYRNALRMIYKTVPELADKPVDAIGKLDMKLMIAAATERKFTRQTMSLMLAITSLVLQEAEECGMIATNPAQGMRKHLPRKRNEEAIPKAMTPEQARLFLSTAARVMPAHHRLFRLMMFTGLRISEALALTWEDIDLKARELLVRRSKTGKSRRVDLSLEALAALGEPPITAAPRRLFVKSYRAAMSQSSVRNALKAVLDAAGLPHHFTPHSTRHTYASILLSSGAPIQYVQRQLGHASIVETVGTYGSHLPMRDLASLDRLDAVITKAGQEAVK